MDRIVASYLIETPGDPRTAAESLAGEQSSGTFVEVPGEDKALRDRFRARVEQVQELESVDYPSLPGSRPAGKSYHRAKVSVSWSMENFGTNLPTLISTLQGNLYELAGFSGLKLMDFELPETFVEKFRGPAFGIAGTRRLTGVYERPLIGTIIKPSVGLTPWQTADRVKLLAEARVDFIKDDELMANPPHSPFNERVAAVMKVLRRHADKTGKQVMYAFNISDELETMQRHYETIIREGGCCAMLSLNSVGLTAVKQICDRGELVVHGHRNGWGMLNRHPLLGIDFCAYQKLWRLAGVDQIHVNGISNKFWEPDDSVVHSIESCRTPFLSGFEVLPVVSSGQWGGQAPETWRRTRTVDLLYMAGGGIMAHPDGPGGGVRALRQAWDGAIKGKSIQEIANESPEFARSLDKFGENAKTAPAQ